MRGILFSVLMFSMIFMETSATKVVAKTLYEVEVVIVMYHSISGEGIQDVWSITVDDMRHDLEYLRNHGYKTVRMSDLVEFVNGEGTLPEKAVVLTFDDGYLNNYTELLPLLEEYGYCATVSVIGERIERQSGNPQMKDSDFMTWEQVVKLHESGHIELANHTWDMHTAPSADTTLRVGCTQKSGETLMEYHATLRNDIDTYHEAFAQHGLPIPICFTYPHGRIAIGGESVIYNAGYRTTLSTDSGSNVLRKGIPNDLYNLKRVNRASDRPLSEILIKYFGEVAPVLIDEPEPTPALALSEILKLLSSKGPSSK